jgi:hypothetical protein
MEMPSINYINTTQPALNLLDLNKDVLTVILEFLNMKDACRLYRTGSKILREAIAETEFDFYSTYERIPRGVSVKQFRKVFVNAIGIGISESWRLTNEDFYYMVPMLCKNNPKGLQKVKIDMSYYEITDLSDKKYKKYKRNAFNNLKGIHSLNISGNRLVGYRHLKTQTDIKCLIMQSCNHIHQSILQYFTKVESLKINNCKRMTDNALTFIKSKNLETLHIVGCYRITLSTIEKFLEEYPIKIRDVDYDFPYWEYENIDDQGYDSYYDEDDDYEYRGGTKMHKSASDDW